MRSILIRILFFTQYFLLKISSLFFGLRKRKKIGTVIGVEEIASILNAMGGAINDSATVNFNKNLYYDHHYTYDLSEFSKIPLLRSIISPLLLGYLSSKYKNFIYISGAGYLHTSLDGREREFKHLRNIGCNVICYFTGSDIRSFELTKEFSEKFNIDVITTYQHISHPNINTEKSELLRKKLAFVADKYASAIFNPKVDQMSYINKMTYPFLYFVDEKKIINQTNKFDSNQEVVIVHAPSSPLIKGTPLVRAAIKKLQEEGYRFDYIELIGMPNKLVLETLAKAHIVLNEFYAFVPGVFGIEAMMNNTVLLTSADKNIETTLLGNANEAWVVTPYWLIYDKLKEQLDKPIPELKAQADKGTEWIKQYCTYSFSAKYLNNVIDSIKND